MQDIYDLVRNNSSMPQIYDIDGINAHQWNWMTVGLPQQNNIPVAYLLGTLTQWDACSFWSNTREECVIQRTYNKPEDAMTDLAYLQRPYLFDYQSDMSWDDCTLDDCVWTPNWLP